MALEDADFSDAFCQFLQAAVAALAPGVLLREAEAAYYVGYTYLLRVLGFGLILAAIVDKNVSDKKTGGGS